MFCFNWGFTMPKKEGTKFRFRNTLFWAEDGMICIEDLTNGNFHTVMVRDFLLRLRSTLRSLDRFKYWDEREEHMKLVEDGIKACREAQAQGRPDDPKAVAFIRRHIKRGGKYVTGVDYGKPGVKSVTQDPEVARELPTIYGPDGEPFFLPKDNKQSRKIIIP